MLDRGLVTAPSLWRYFDAVRPRLFRFLAVDERSLARSLEAAIGPPPALTKDR